MTSKHKMLSHSSTNRIKTNVNYMHVVFFNFKKFWIFSTHYIYLFRISLKSMAILWLNNINLLTCVIGKRCVLCDLRKMALLHRIGQTLEFV